MFRQHLASEYIDLIVLLNEIYLEVYTIFSNYLLILFPLYTLDLALIKF